MSLAAFLTLTTATYLVASAILWNKFKLGDLAEAADLVLDG
jgi:hypothetical protein